MGPFGEPRRSSAAAGALPATSAGYSPVANTPTRCCCGIFSAKVGMQLILVATILDGLWHVLGLLNDTGSDAPVFRWGPPGYEVPLQVASAAVGAASIAVGAAGLWYTRRLRVKGLGRVVKYLRANVVWTSMWYLLVGLPVDVVYARVPVVETWPLSVAPGVPHKLIVDPNWPNGMPSVCQDITDMKAVLALRLNEMPRQRWLKPILRKVYNGLLKRVLPCRTVVKLFWSSMVLFMAMKVWFVQTAEFFYKVVQHGGDGELMIGSLSDLDAPADGRSVQELMHHQIAEMFHRMDQDRDGRVSIEELMVYLHTHSELYKRAASRHAEEA